MSLKEVFVPLLRVAATGVILVHTHPSGDPTPSNADVVLTYRVAQVGQLLGIEVVEEELDVEWIARVDAALWANSYDPLTEPTVKSAFSTAASMAFSAAGSMALMTHCAAASTAFGVPGGDLAGESGDWHPGPAGPLRHQAPGY